ncbi:hypothetical protein GmHk_18G052633 [Glycine max]|nr:hypothetical protein GmHk_18G052633 [Glycine max]
MSFSAGFAYLEGERVNNIVWDLERFRGLFLRNDRLPILIATNRDLALMNVVKTVFPECTNLLCRVESAHWALKRVLQNSLGDLCSVWDAMNNMITLQHVEIKASFETSTHVVGHVFKKTLYKRLVGMVSRNALNEIAAEVKRLRYLGNDSSSCGCVMRSMLGLPCACELSKYTIGNIPVDSVHMFWRRLYFLDQGLCEAEVSIKEEIETISKRFEELAVCGKLTLKSKLQDIAYPDHNSMCPTPSKDFIHNVVDVKADGNCGYQSIAALLDVYVCLIQVSVDKWMDITEMRYVIASRYNVILVLLSRQQSMTFFPLRSQLPPDSSVHRMICVGHVFGNHFV